MYCQVHSDYSYQNFNTSTTEKVYLEIPRTDLYLETERQADCVTVSTIVSNDVPLVFTIEAKDTSDGNKHLHTVSPDTLTVYIKNGESC